jgi:phosphoribosyl 1,2-cyclic phosphodiesterase
MKVWVLGSGSRGNAVLLECGDTRVLIDAGFPPRELARRLTSTGVAPASIAACLITHEHTDHVRGAAACAAKWGWQLYASEGTIGAYPSLGEADARGFEAGASLRVGQLELRSVPAPHDSADPVVFVATSTPSGVRAGICYDLGVVTDAVRGAFRDLDILVLESNHDEGMLRAGPYPPVVCNRIASRTGHLSNRAAAAFARECVNPNLAHVVLAHLSENCNEADVAARATTERLQSTRFRGTVGVALQDTVVGPFTAKASRMARAEQLALGL